MKDKEIKLDILSNKTHYEVLEEIKKCYAVVLPSFSEDSPNFILEAISFGKPFILTKDNGYYEKLEDIGLFIDPFNTDDIKNKILFLSEKSIL